MTSAPAITTDHYPLYGLDAYSAFLNLRERWGFDQVFLLESFSEGPSRDARASFIGFAPALTIAVSGQTAKIEGQDALLQHLRDRLQSTDFAIGHDQYVSLTSRAALWDLLRRVQAALVSSTANGTDLKRLGYFGYFGYDVVHSIEALPRTIPDNEKQCDVEVCIYRGLVEFDIQTGSGKLIIHRAPELWDEIDEHETMAVLASRRPVPNALQVTAPLNVRGTIRKDCYEHWVHQALHHISVGDIYQVQLGHEVIVRSDADPLSVYHRLRDRNPSPYMYFAPFRSFTLIGASPELYVRAEGRSLSMRPIAGTAPRSANPQENELRISRLKNDEKEIAEHIMLVDLCRNDLGRVCVPNTLSVDELLAVERYSHVYHLVSNVSAERGAEYDIYDVIRATFPAGTMTGAPKIRAMEIIEATEETRRGPYAGAVGMIAFNGDANLALCIRTAVYSESCYCLRASAGVVADSTPEREWNETLHKMAALYWAITDTEISHESIGC